MDPDPDSHHEHWTFTQDLLFFSLIFLQQFDELITYKDIFYNLSFLNSSDFFVAIFGWYFDLGPGSRKPKSNGKQWFYKRFSKKKTSDLSKKYVLREKSKVWWMTSNMSLKNVIFLVIDLWNGGVILDLGMSVQSLGIHMTGAIIRGNYTSKLTISCTNKFVLNLDKNMLKDKLD